MPDPWSSRKGSSIPFMTFFFGLTAGILLFPPAASSHTTMPSDAGTIDGVVQALYESISFPKAKTPDWDRFRNLFLSSESPCIRTASDGVLVMNREDFIAFFEARIRKGTLKSFFEREIARSTERYGGLAQVFSTYEKRINPDDPGTPTRGINSLQLFFKDGRWWICSLVWQDEHVGLPIPPKYLEGNPVSSPSLGPAPLPASFPGVEERNPVKKT